MNNTEYRPAKLKENGCIENTDSLPTRLLPAATADGVKCSFMLAEYLSSTTLSCHRWYSITPPAQLFAWIPPTSLRVHEVIAGGSLHSSVRLTTNIG